MLYQTYIGCWWLLQPPPASKSNVVKGQGPNAGKRRFVFEIRKHKTTMGRPMSQETRAGVQLAQLNNLGMVVGSLYNLSIFLDGKRKKGK